MVRLLTITLVWNTYTLLWPTLWRTVTTRSMAKTDHNCDTVENARDNILTSPMKVLSPESVHNSVHQESDNDSPLSSSSDIPNLDSGEDSSSDDEADPHEPEYDDDYENCTCPMCSYWAGEKKTKKGAVIYQCPNMCEHCMAKTTFKHKRYMVRDPGK